MIDYQYIYNYYDNFPVYIRLAWIVSGVLALAIVVLTIYLKLIRIALRNKFAENIKFKSTYEALLVEYLYSGSDNGAINEAQKSILANLKDAIKTHSKRKIIVSVLYNLMNEVSGEMSDSIKLFYTETGLINYAFERLKSKKWNVVAK